MQRPTRHASAGLVALSLLWGSAFVAIKEAVGQVSATTLAILRFGVADVCLVFLMIVWPKARPRFARGDFGRLVALGLLVPAYHLALNWGEERTSASVASLVVATGPVVVAILSRFIGERLTARGVLGIALAFGGVALLALGMPGREEPTRTLLTGLMATLAAAWSWAAYTVVAKPLAVSREAIQVTTLSILIGSVALVPLIRPSTFREAASLDSAGWGWVVLLGAGASAAAYVVFGWVLSNVGATRLAVSVYSIPIVALLMAWLVRGERLDPLMGLAGALVIIGIALTQGRGVEELAPADSAAEPPQPAATSIVEAED